jgi:hypothetical protein
VAGAGAGDWLLPGVEPTFWRADVLAIVVVGFERARLRSQRILWDHATLVTQLGIAHGTATGRAASGLAR